MSHYPQGSYGFQGGDPHDNRQCDMEDRFQYWFDETKDELKAKYLEECGEKCMAFDQEKFEVWAWEYWEAGL